MPAIVRTNYNTTDFIVHDVGLVMGKPITIKQNVGRATVLAANTLMGQNKVLSSITTSVHHATATGNTGNGTCTSATVVGVDSAGNRVVPAVGNWQFRLTAALVGKIIDPSGVDVKTAIALNDGTTTVIKECGLQFIITDGGTAFEADDGFYLPVVADGDYVPYDPDSVVGAAIPQCIYTGTEISAATIVAGDVSDCDALFYGAVVDDAMLVIENGGALTDTVPGTGLSVEDYLARQGLYFKTGVAAYAYQRA